MNAPNMEAPGEVGTEGRAQGTTDNADCAACTADPPAAHRERVAAADKVFQTLRARFALAGWMLHITATDGRAQFLVSRWGQVREFDSLAELEAFALQVGVQP